MRGDTPSSTRAAATTRPGSGSSWTDPVRGGGDHGGGRVFERLMADSALDVQEPRLDPSLVAEGLRDHFGVAGRLTRISTEKDDTFLLAPTSGGRRWLVKVSSSYEDPGTVDLQSAAVEHVQRRDRTLPVPRLLRTVDGQRGAAVFAGPGPHPRVLRVLSYLEGTPLGSRFATPAQCRSIGGHLARLSLALRDLRHPSAGRLLAWDLRHFDRLRPLLVHVEDSELRRCIEHQFTVFEENVEPLLGGARTQVVHNDLNRFNTLVDAGASHAVCGIIDFGDVVHTAVAFDLAIAVAGHLRVCADPWADGLEVVRGYLAERPLPQVELEIVAWSAPVRIALRALLTAHQSALNPERGDYLHSHARDDLDLLRTCADPGSTLPVPVRLQHLAADVDSRWDRTRGCG